jgi:hypothetical protein
MALDARDVSAVLVTRGDVDISTILNSLPFDDVVVWDNSQREDLKCYGRFAAITECKYDHIYVQDDDVLVPVAELLRKYDGKGIHANRRLDEQYRFLGLGAIFPRRFVNVFYKYLAAHPKDEDFYRAADVVFTEMNPYHSVWLGYLDFPWATADNRMYKQPDHYRVRNKLIARARAL